MSFPTCPLCGAPLGPWEGGRCLSHEPGRARSIADQAVLVLEREPGPVYLHDIERGIGREAGRRTERQSVSAVVGADRRFCWSGKGMYALFRHGRIPWARTLADVAAFILLAADAPLTAEELGFLMKWSGYRFQDVSLDSALRRERRFEIGWHPGGSGSSLGWKVKLKDPDAEQLRFDVLRQPIAFEGEAVLDAIFGGDGSSSPADYFAHEPDQWPLDELLLSWRELVRTGLRERSKRLGDDEVREAVGRGS